MLGCGLESELYPVEQEGHSNYFAAVDFCHALGQTKLQAVMIQIEVDRVQTKTVAMITNVRDYQIAVVGVAVAVEAVAVVGAAAAAVVGAEV